ncbi:hypothetical protein CQW23_08607 [Capsicum baccatum]|uniref:Uncharacterized protein n=1 Tax=Capsicum baccatum TaxID=33114 RepID=A0A2G2X9H4_CAPBA|nr:hypothetical protein CQW23_08607 [Capsicum baccatum]
MLVPVLPDDVFSRFSSTKDLRCFFDLAVLHRFLVFLLFVSLISPFLPRIKLCWSTYHLKSFGKEIDKKLLDKRMQNHSWRKLSYRRNLDWIPRSNSHMADMVVPPSTTDFLQRVLPDAMVHRLLYEANILTGRRVFGAQKKQTPESRKKVTSDNYYGTVIVKMNDSLAKENQTKSANAKSAISLHITEPVVSKPDAEEIDENSDTDSGGEMVDGILTSGTKSTYEIPSQEELSRHALADDDVEDEFRR